MTLDAFNESLTHCNPPEGLNLALEALWCARQEGDGWARAHDLAQRADCPEGDWVHAYLHRVEGDANNARYWYTRARKPESQLTLAQEWDEIVTELLKAGAAKPL